MLVLWRDKKGRAFLPKEKGEKTLGHPTGAQEFWKDYR